MLRGRRKADMRRLHAIAALLAAVLFAAPPYAGAVQATSRAAGPDSLSAAAVDVTRSAASGSRTRLAGPREYASPAGPRASGSAREADGWGGQAAGAPAAFAGWAMDAYPGDSVALLESQMRQQLAAGANIVWLGHNNPGEVGTRKSEPGLSFAVWQAFEDAGSPLHADAVDMLQAVRNALNAARALGIQVVLPVGYQIQMGAAWNSVHPRDLRVDGRGKVYDAGGESASFYAPDYRRDILAYYRWVDGTLVRPYGTAIEMLNMADEPADGDYSIWADSAFRARYGFSMSAAGTNAQRQASVGRFQADYIADYAAWSARQWLAIDPAVKVTMSFDGGYGRVKHEGPDLEAIFQEAPENFVVTFDAYPKDGLYTTPAHSADLYALFSLVRTLGYYSAIYNRPLWLWSTANSWGLNGASSDPGTIADAVANAIYLAQLARQTGGDLQGIAVWNYNIKGQGLFNDTHRYYYDPRLMFARVSATFPLLRGIMPAPAGRPDALILASNAHDLLVAGRTRAMRALDSYDWTALAAFAHDDEAAPIVTHLISGGAAGVRAVVVLDRTASGVTPADRAALAGVLDAGGSVLASAPVATLLAPAAADVARVAAGTANAGSIVRYRTTRGTLLAVQGVPVEQIFADANQTWAGGVVQALFRAGTPQAGFLVSFGGTTLLYGGLAGSGTSFTIDAPLPGSPADLVVYDAAGVAVRTVKLAGQVAVRHVEVQRRAYALAVGAGLAG